MLLVSTFPAESLPASLFKKGLSENDMVAWSSGATVVTQAFSKKFWLKTPPIVGVINRFKGCVKALVSKNVVYK